MKNFFLSLFSTLLLFIIVFFCGRFSNHDQYSKLENSLASSYEFKLEQEMKEYKDSCKHEYLSPVFSSAYDEGYSLGYYEGFVMGEEEALNSNSNYHDGYQTGYSIGYNLGYDEAFYSAYEAYSEESMKYSTEYVYGYDTGYEDGYDDGKELKISDYMRIFNSSIPFLVALILASCAIIYAPWFDSKDQRHDS